MRFKGTIRKSELITAIVVGGMTGLVGFALFMSLLHFSSNRPLEQKEPDEVIQTVTNETTEYVDVYASQYGVFSTREGAEQFIASDPSLSQSSIITHQGKYYIWKRLEFSPPEHTETPSAYWKQVKLLNRCENYPQLLEDFKQIYENNFSKENDLLANFPVEWQPKIQQTVAATDFAGILFAVLLAEDQRTTACFQLEF